MPSFPGTEDALNFTFTFAIILTFLFVIHVAFGLLHLLYMEATLWQNCYPCEVINQIRWIPNKGEKLNASQFEIGMYKSEEEILTRQAYIVEQTRET